MLTSPEISSGSLNNHSVLTGLIYNQAHYYQQDQSDLQAQVANYYADAGGVSRRLKDFLKATFPVLRKGNYDITIRYILPGKDIIASEQTITINNPYGP
jgi:hypothetical protein